MFRALSTNSESRKTSFYVYKSALILFGLKLKKIDLASK